MGLATTRPLLTTALPKASSMSQQQLLQEMSTPMSGSTTTRAKTVVATIVQMHSVKKSEKMMEEIWGQWNASLWLTTTTVFVRAASVLKITTKKQMGTGITSTASVSETSKVETQKMKATRTGTTKTWATFGSTTSSSKRCFSPDKYCWTSFLQQWSLF